MLFFRRGTASQAFLFGPFVDTAGAAVTDLTISTATIRLSANGGNMVGKNTGGSTHDENGWYTTTLDTADTTTVGRLQISANNSSALPVWMEGQVLEETIYDALFADGANAWSGSTGASRITGLADGVITSSAIAADAFTAAAVADGFITSSAFAAGAIDAAAIAANAIGAAEIADGAIDAATFAAGAIDAAAIATDAITSAEISAGAVTKIGNGVWDVAQIESTGVPPVTGTHGQYMRWWAALSANEVQQTATNTAVRNRADSANLSTSAVSDDATTFTRGVFST